MYVHICTCVQKLLSVWSQSTSKSDLPYASFCFQTIHGILLCNYGNANAISFLLPFSFPVSLRNIIISFSTTRFHPLFKAEITKSSHEVHVGPHEPIYNIGASSKNVVRRNGRWKKCNNIHMLERKGKSLLTSVFPNFLVEYRWEWVWSKMELLTKYIPLWLHLYIFLQEVKKYNNNNDFNIARVEL